MGDITNGLVSGIGGEAYKDVRDKVSKEIYWIKNLGENRKRLVKGKEKLCARRDDIDQKIKDKSVGKELQLWMSKASNLEKDVETLEDKYDKQNGYKWTRLFRIFSRSKLSESISVKVTEIQKCWEEGEKYAADVVVEVPRRLVVKKGKVRRIDNIPSLYQNFEKILQFLQDNDLKRIGLWGKVGVGKTVIMHNLKEDRRIAEMFDVVIFVTVKNEWDEEKLTREIAKQIGLNFDNIDSDSLATEVEEKLKSKRYLLLLDDVCKFFELNDVGICDNKMRSKILLASRDLGICRSMLVDDSIDVKPLSPNDALKLFEEELGRKVSEKFRPTAQLIIRECGYLPLLIDKVAVNFRNKDTIPLWRAGLERLRIWPDVEDRSMSEVLNLLRFCYEELPDQNSKKCFLYTALYSEGCDIYSDYLIECWKAEGYIHYAMLSFRDRGQEILHDLINVSLLENSEKAKHIRMDKIFRKLAHKILSESVDSKCLVSAGKGLQESPDEKAWKHVKWISLMDNKFCKLPKMPDCSNLSTLLLQRNGALEMIPGVFFKLMQNLRVLDLHGTNIKSLPSSISRLRHLRALYLNSCKRLLALPSEVKALELLEVLDIRGTIMDSLPVEIGCLNSLWCLRLSFSKGDAPKKFEVYYKEISKLCSLKELVVEMDREGQWRQIMRDTADLEGLKHLLFSIGQYHAGKYKMLDYFEYGVCKCLAYANGDDVDPRIGEVISEFDAFELTGHKGVVRLSDFGVDNINKMRSCLIDGCSEMETIIEYNPRTDPVFGCLEKMYISNVPKLQTFWKGAAIPSGSLAKLTTLVFFKCPMLERILSNELFHQLTELEHLEVESCHELKVIVESEDRVMNLGVLPRMKEMILVDLPKLVSIWCDKDGESLEWPRSEKFVIEGCPLLKRHPGSAGAVQPVEVGN